MARTDARTGLSWISKLASIAIVIAALFFAKAILVPFTIAVLLTFLLVPLCDALERFKIGRIPATLMAALVAFAILGIVIGTVAVQLNELARQLPEYEENITAKLHSVSDYFHETMLKIS